MYVLHLYETFGWWRRADYLKVHFAESWNEMHHLLIMEELGGNSWWFDRFLAQHIAVFYYFMIVVMYMISPRMAYELKKRLASEVAVKYYIEGDLYLLDEFQTARYPNSRRPKMENFVRCVSQYKRRRSRALQDVGVEVDRPAEETPAEVETEVFGA
ncbi:ubiquinol oxidase 4, chloroplastic/chromoplastic-like [Papaver somniferum]|uniref:ubiquinol oxidase 4, chloroplastic/chromoplastic-like n=1 Tax=Papaver somniferum TaxID=3469 RepID=UPI000E6F9A8A|nr:ubiquinol oxidase 4, chloroplastic/chromoplastic-like [Papaver somniferum]XP_026395173.1 ubiquinol oxidase 4, chloroplastic/chromoplastic-like [Papaver somniferum]XP_026395174.1 ubiquinol oxidase 4, chloroplastic/chromoplastic-like [Papaver somniferum]XP_026395175.1 ubiquinol oxidase 4, chloroplastic/chromoplastic-like [Papaver somniferum]